MEGVGIITALMMLFFGLMPFIALMCIWSNTGKTAHYTELLWRAVCEDEGRDPKTGKKISAAQPLNG